MSGTFAIIKTERQNIEDDMMKKEKIISLRRNSFLSCLSLNIQNIKMREGAE